VFRNAKKIICVLLSIKVHYYFAFSGIQHGISQLKKGPTYDYVIMITMVRINNKEIGWYTFSRDVHIHVASNT
jgi:hypothetical protein